ncbi:MAG TPA: thermonuclease family protein [Acidimicrobiales bacterium]|nr:thermonuclease family protein [Acidimicrobiales bacterium]
MRPALLLVLLLLPACARSAPAGDRGLAVVDHVVDGDTVVVDLNGRSETLRLIGVDTPETVDPDTPPECFGPEASDRTKALLPPGTEVRLTRDVEARDRYDRLLVYVERADDGLFVNLDLVAGGWADDSPFPPNLAHQRQFALAASQARAGGLGLWGRCGGAGSPSG